MAAMGYPEILCEYVDASKRYESFGTQFVYRLESEQLARGEMGMLVMSLQNVLDTDTEFVIKPDVPKSGRFGGSPMLEFVDSEISVPLKAAQVGVARIPFAVTSHAKDMAMELKLKLSTMAPRHAKRIRGEAGKGKLGETLFDSARELGIIPVLGAPYETTNVKDITVVLNISGDAPPTGAERKFDVEFESWWKQEMAEAQFKAQQEVNERRAVLVDEFSAEPLYTRLHAEGARAFDRIGLTLRIGEAIALGKILHFTARYFLDDPELQDGLLVNIWKMALEFDYPTGEPMDVMAEVGLHPLLKLAAAMSFNLVARRLGRQPWLLDERIAVSHFIANTVYNREPLDVEFLYLPLMMGAVCIHDSAVMEGEDAAHSLKLLNRAYSRRTSLFLDEDMEEARDIFEQLLYSSMEQT